MRKHPIKITAIFIIVVLFATQPEKSNPKSDPSDNIINSKLTITDTVKSLLRASCFDCHSNETKWVWYTYVPIASHFTIGHVNDARKHLNFSKWKTYKAGRKLNKLAEIKEFVSNHEMPLKSYLWLHPEADLTEEQRKIIIDWAIEEVDSMSSLIK